MGDDMYETQCDKVKKIVLPESIITITNSDEKTGYFADINNEHPITYYINLTS